jgi:diphthamide synthase subunit DPH2
MPYFRKFVIFLFLFYKKKKKIILIYSQNLEEHLEHLKNVLETLEQYQLYAKNSKCVFGYEIEYLGHSISKEMAHQR